MHFAKPALLALATGALAQKPRHPKGNPHPDLPTPRNPIETSQKKPGTGPDQPKREKPAAYHGPGKYYIQNQATNTTMDLYYGEAGADTEINGYTRTDNNDHQIRNVVAAAQYHQVAIINSATGAIASCASEANDNGLLQLKGGELALDGNSLMSSILLDSSNILV